MQQTVSIVGLGAMGVRLVDLYLKKSWRVTVWNRDARKAAAVVERGARLAEDVAAAVAASPRTLMVVSNDEAVRQLLEAPGVATAIGGRTLIQLTTVEPETARSTDRWASEHGGSFLAGAIQAAPSQMGEAETPVLVSGRESTWQAQRSALTIIAGGAIYLGRDPGAASTMDLATLSWVYGSMLGFIHGASIAQADGIDVAAYGNIVRKIAPSFGAFFAHEGAVIQSGDFAISESPLRISVDATARLLDTARRSGINTEIPAFIAGIFQRAEQAGLADEEAAALVKLFRGPDEAASRGLPRSAAVTSGAGAGGAPGTD